MASILVTGGTGNLGRHVVPLLRAQGHDLRVLSRRPRANADGIEYVVGDTVSGVGLDAAVAGIDTVVHLAGSGKGDDVGTAHLADAAREARVGHVVMISVVGADRMPIGYFGRRIAQSGASPHPACRSRCCARRSSTTSSGGCSAAW